MKTSYQPLHGRSNALVIGATALAVAIAIGSGWHYFSPSSAQAQDSQSRTRDAAQNIPSPKALAFGDSSSLGPEARLQHLEALDRWLQMSADPAKAVAVASQRAVEVYRAQGEPDKAIEFLREALKDLNNPKANLVVRQILAEFLIEQRRTEEGMAEYRELVRFGKNAM